MPVKVDVSRARDWGNAPIINTWGLLPLPDRFLGTIQLRHIALALGLSFWLGLILMHSNQSGLLALALSALFLSLALIISSATRTVPILTVVTVTLGGAFMLGFSGYVEKELAIRLMTNGPVLPNIVLACLEEVLKLVPVFILLWLRRNFIFLTFGATDVMLLGVAAGLGFGLVEEAQICSVQAHAAMASPEGWWWLPTAYTTGQRFVAGDVVWTGIATCTIGWALLRRGQSGLLLGASGLVLAILDHYFSALQYDPTDFFSTRSLNEHQLAAVWSSLTFHGTLVLTIFFICIAISIFFDRFILRNALPKVPEFKMPSKDGQWNKEDFWDFVLDRRRLAYVYYRYLNEPNKAHSNVALVVAILMQHVTDRHAVEPEVVENEQIKESTNPDLVPTISGNFRKIPVAEGWHDRTTIDLPERYSVESLMAEGGMGVIYKARHKMTGAYHAIKILHPHLTSDQINIKRFEQEAKAASSLKHPNLIVIHDFGITPSNIPYLVMDWIDGTSLQQEMKQHGPLSISRFLNIFIQVSDALAHAHKQGVIHRDLKPSNMILEGNDRGADVVRIVDFGIAKMINDESGCGYPRVD